MNFIQAYLILVGVFCLWQTVEKTQMVLNCNNIIKHNNYNISFITFKSCPHLDGKHSVFGKITHGLDFLDKVEGLPANDKD